LKTIKKIFRKLFRITPKRKRKATNIYVGKQQMDCILAWENNTKSDVIRSSFNRELYYKYLQNITK